MNCTSLTALRGITVTISFLFVHSLGHAQAPLRFENSSQALRLQSDATINQLRKYCSQLPPSETVFDRPELSAISTGLITGTIVSPKDGRYSFRAFDAETSTFYHVKGQRIKKGVLLSLPLALPRDFRYCRIVRDAEGFEQVEVLEKDSNVPSSGTEMKQLLIEAKTLSTKTTGLMCPQPGAPLKFRIDGATVPLLHCHEPTALLFDRINAVFRAVFP